jgi:hypothetical protein
MDAAAVNCHWNNSIEQHSIEQRLQGLSFERMIWPTALATTQLENLQRATQQA